MPRRAIFQALLPGSTDANRHSNESSPKNIEHIAIDNHGVIGSVYDGFEDNVTGKKAANVKIQLSESENDVRCLLVKGRTAQSQNLLKFIDIDDQLRLSIALKMVQTTGIVSLIDYPRKMYEHTRLLYIYQESHIESCKHSMHQLIKPVTRSTSETFATHVITEIIYGIHLLVILQLTAEYEESIGRFLVKLQENVIKKISSDKISSEDKALLGNISSLTVYSNVSELTKITQLVDLYKRIKELQTPNQQHPPLKYILTPIYYFYGQYHDSIPKLAPFKPNETEFLEHYLVQRLSELKRLNLRVNHSLPDLLQGKLDQQLNDIQKDFSKIQKMHNEEIRMISQKLSKVRQGKASLHSIDLNSQTAIQRSIQTLITSLDELESKGSLIERLGNKGFKYQNVVDLGIKQGVNDQRVRNLLLRNDSYKVVFCSIDVFRTYQDDDWEKQFAEIIEESQTNQKLNLVYADFTYSTYALRKMLILTSRDITVDDEQSNTQSSDSNVKTNTSPPLPTITDECINILLLGESGVGKSTFINAFANYLYFSSLDEAQQGEPVVVIPVSFLMTINDNFDEKIVKFGDVDSNENHNHSGQSVTQQCKSYVFNLSNGKKLRIIDTPGFGDTRGSNQDNLNMDEIFSFLNNLSYIHGICLLFKPEITQLNSYFRSCCTQLFDYFGEKVRDRFIFCFTNTRSTFFVPGNTRPLLKTFFASFPVQNISMEKRNTFCFDSESFRYLIALQNDITFAQSDRKEFEQSWLRSVGESRRFRDYLLNQSAYRRSDEWQSMKEVQYQIELMICPMLEAMRNLLRNMCLYKLDLSIQLHAVPVESSTTICYSCSRTPEKFDQLWILPDHLHHTLNTCPSNVKKSTEYRLHYELHDRPDAKTYNDLERQLNLLDDIGAKFSYFFMRILGCRPDDLFLNGLQRMMKEERSICGTQTSKELNAKVMHKLSQAKDRYEEHLNDIKLAKEAVTLSDVYNSIELVRQISMVNVQLDAIRKYHQCLLEKNERIVHTAKEQKN